MLAPAIAIGLDPLMPMGSTAALRSFFGIRSLGKSPNGECIARGAFFLPMVGALTVPVLVRHFLRASSRIIWLAGDVRVETIIVDC